MRIEARGCTSVLVVLATLGWSTREATAQRVYDPLPGGHLPAATEATRHQALGDFDGDGDLDLVWSVVGGPRRLLRNDGNGVFEDVTATQMPSQTADGTPMAVGDIDGDGDLDLAFANGTSAARVQIYRNQGGGLFVDATAALVPNQPLIPTDVAFADVDGDQDLDLVLASGSTVLRHGLLCNDGSGVFTDRTLVQMPPATATSPADRVLAHDFDGDGDVDLAFGGDRLQLLANDGSGTFTDVSAQRVPSTTFEIRNMVAGDVDGDGDDDLLLGRDFQNTMLRNVGGTFVDVTVSTLPFDSGSDRGLLLADLDQDGDLDVVTTDVSLQRIWINLGNGAFVDTLSLRLQPRADISDSVVAGDVDGDGDVDLVFGNLDLVFGIQGSHLVRNRLALNDGTGRFVDAVRDPTAPGWQAQPTVAHGDVDGDGDRDFVEVGSPQFLTLWRNDGVGTFTSTVLPAGPDPAWGQSVLLLFDADGDGDLDLFVAGRLLRNGGAGSFVDVTSTSLPVGLVGHAAVVAGDFDADGDTDLVALRWGGRSFLANDGLGQFVDETAARLPALQGGLNALAAADLEGDGDLDLVVPGLGSGILANDGTGVFVDATGGQPIAASGNVSVVVAADFDGDGDADLLIGRESGVWPEVPASLYRNDGASGFTDVSSTNLPPLTGLTLAAAAGDIDLDGDLDLVVGGSSQGPPPVPDLLLRNDGSGVFTDMSSVWAASDDDRTRSINLADFDQDGDLDLLLANERSRNVWWNLRRHLDAPFLLRPGRPWRIDAYVRARPATSLDFVLPWLSLQRAIVELPPLGTVGIVPQTPLPVLVVTQPLGRAQCTVPVPNTTALVDVTVYAQGVVVGSAADVRLTNVTVRSLTR